MIQIAIVEDEEIYVKQLTEYIRKYQTERGRSIKVTVFDDGEDIIENCVALGILVQILRIYFVLLWSKAGATAT